MSTLKVSCKSMDCDVNVTMKALMMMLSKNDEESLQMRREFMMLIQNSINRKIKEDFASMFEAISCIEPGHLTFDTITNIYMLCHMAFMEKRKKKAVPTLFVVPEKYIPEMKRLFNNHFFGLKVVGGEDWQIK